MASKRLVWFITGCSTGLGRQLVLYALSRNDIVIATARSISKIRDLETEDCHILELDVTHPMEKIRAVVDQAERICGKVDVVVNNAGAGLLGMTEEIGSETYHEQFKVNFYGPLNVTNAFLSYMRPRREGTLVFVGSRSAFRTNVLRFGPYSASKAALAAAADVLASELQPFNIKVFTVLPGGMRSEAYTTANKRSLSLRTSDGNSMAEVSSSNNIKFISYYTPYREESFQKTLDLDGKQFGDPILNAKAIIDVVHDALEGRAQWPRLGMLALGEDAEKDIREKCNDILRNLDENLKITQSTGYPK